MGITWSSTSSYNSVPCGFVLPGAPQHMASKPKRQAPFMYCTKTRQAPCMYCTKTISCKHGRNFNVNWGCSYNPNIFFEGHFYMAQCGKNGALNNLVQPQLFSKSYPYGCKHHLGPIGCIRCITKWKYPARQSKSHRIPTSMGFKCRCTRLHW